MFAILALSVPTSFNNNQMVADDVADQLRAGSKAVFGVMVESHLVEGRQDLVEGRELTLGQSITDAACIDWEDSETLLRRAMRSQLATPAETDISAS